jgi:hypothetical protein
MKVPNYLLPLFSFILVLLIFGRPTAAQDASSSQLLTPNSDPLAELFRLRIVNQKGGEIAVSRDLGATWQKIGAVLIPCQKVEPKGYTASKWITPVRIAATAVNAIHITTDYDPQTDRGVVISLVPKQVIVGNSFSSPQASITTDFAAGTGLFGGGFAPFVGNRVWVERDGTMAPAEKGYVPALGDALIIPVERYVQQPSQLIFENREAGQIYLQFPDGSRKVIGRVLRPVHGVGRFSGTQYADLGRIRANHAGVIDISCGPLGVVAGFQIIPEKHAHDPEMHLALTKTQWMIVAPLNPGEAWEGVAPLFYQYIRPNYRPDDLYASDWRERLLGRFLAEVQFNDGPWGPIPAFNLNPYLQTDLPVWADSALADVTAVRILFPLD